MQHSVDVAIIGAGFAGLTAAIRLQQRGNTSFVIFERAEEVGGTWRDNIYPGCGCDIPSPLYSFSFAPNPDWTRMYSGQPEILSYIKQTVSRFNLRPHIQFNAEIIRTEFAEETGRWTLTDRAGHQTTARVVLVAIGPLNRPALPQLPGLGTFAGKTFHSSQWDTDYDLQGKRVAVIGTGASAVQFVPQIAPLVSQLYVFQRTAPWILPRRDRAFSEKEKTWFRRLPLLQRVQRELIYWRNELFGLLFMGNKKLAAQANELAARHLARAIKDPELRRKVTPNYQLGCKRVLISNNYYPSLTRPNVELVTEGIREVTPTGIVTHDGQARPVDAIIFGTGFVASEFMVDLHISGLGGRSLFGEWQQSSAEAYRGTTVSGYPNMLVLVGPNTGLAHNSIIHIMESQVNYVLDYLRNLDQAGAGAYLDVKPEAQRIHNEEVQRKLGTTVWASGCKSWYQTASGKNTTLLHTLTPAFRRSVKSVRLKDYVLRKPERVAVSSEQ
ncbi:flavin-containing monooxygenase [Hymenobacter sp. BRD67]|uniref:flavin-containing monooxygenase n=1 Tax=Hymenobacter sp. BRD67 TaxID=2675877 RepID=UPI001567BC2C|nr:NAD(P)/FAD-dependent oxidoreductase [Hymenobacter sp. BRD67]QKG52525.1 NAD(P)/FAD-dependent oxidoreductase [Hymenobacter sp. BRD67]